MANQDLSEAIKQRLENGETRESIRQHLLSKGWRVDEIDVLLAGISTQPSTASTTSSIQPPFPSLLSAWDAKTANLPAAIVMAIFGSIAFLLLLIAIILYNLLDPLGTRAFSRDVVRESELSQTQTALQRYFDQHQSYPATLNQLVPVFLTKIPLDPSSQKPFTYSLQPDNFNYQLCVDYESRQLSCITSSAAPITSNELPSPAVQISSQASSPYSISGFVFIDYNENGTQDTGDPVFSGASLVVSDDSNNTICSVKTDVSGRFVCGVPAIGTYSVFLNVPFRYRITRTNPQSVTINSSAQVITKFGLVPIDSITSHNSSATNSEGAR